MRRAIGPVVLVGAVTAGIGLGHLGRPSAGGGLLLASVVGGVGALGAPRRTALAAGLVVACVLAAALTLRARDGLDDWRRSLEAREGSLVDVSATVVTDPVPASFGLHTVVRLDGHRVLVRARQPVASRVAVLEPGDRVSLRGWLRADAEARWRHRHVAAELDLLDLTDFSPPRGGLVRTANLVRSTVLGGVRHLKPPDSGLVAGFLVGDTRGVPASVAADFRASGLSHLLAVSGSNVAFVLALAAPLRRRLGLAGRFAAGLAVVGLFATVTRFEPSVLRASAMAALSMTAGFAGRRVSGFRVLALAVAALLLLDPFLVHSAAFRLSCGASAGILTLARPIAARLSGPRALREAFATTVAAQAGVAPVLVPTFGSLPLASIPANLVAGPLAGPLTVWGMVSGVTSSLTAGVSPEVGQVLALPTAMLARTVRAVASVAAEVPVAVDGWLLLGLLSVTALGAAARWTNRAGRGAGGHAP